MSSIQSKLQEKIRRKEQELAELRLRIAAAEAEIKSTKEILAMIVREGALPNRTGNTLQPTSLAGRAYKFLKKEGHPIHLSSILEGIGKANNLKARRALGSQLSSYFRDKQIFTRPAPNTFGLIEWGENQDDDSHGGESETSMDAAHL